MNKLFKLADAFRRKLAKEKPDHNSGLALVAFMIEEDMQEFRMGDIMYYYTGQMAEVGRRPATEREEKIYPEMSSMYLGWWQDWDPPPEMLEGFEEEPEIWPGRSLTSDDLDRMEEKLTDKDMAAVDRRIDFIYAQLRTKLSPDDQLLFVEAVNLSARLEGWRRMMEK